ncbi:ATP-binding protein, partial [Chloroflexales bacterium ZM16-3]|nr:ATP-binding protein [Chloroflexales bacterium ZM16-3]
AAIGVDRRLAEGRLARALLPGLAKRPGGQPEPPLLPDWGDPLTPPSPAAAGAGGWGGEGLSALPMITVAELAAGDNLLIVGSRGSGKTTLLQAILANRQRRCYILDPHSHPGKWPSNAKVLGGGRDFATIYAALLRGEDELTKRAQALNTNAQARFAPFTLASDEWGSVTSEIVVGKDQDPPGRLMIRLLKEGRKFGISFIGCAHGDTAESLGSKGDTAAFRASFDWIVYCGAFVGRELRDIPELARSLPLGRTPEGGTFPLIVVAISPITGARRLLDLRGIGQGLGADRKSVSWSHSPHQQRIAPPRPPQRERGLGGEGVQAPPNDRTDEPTTSALRTREDLVRALLAAGWGVTQIRDTLKGTNSEIGALVRQIEDEQLHQGRS